MPFSLTNAQQFFRLLNHFIFSDLDDIFIFSQNMEKHMQHFWLVLRWLMENKPFVDAEKLEFYVSSLSFLGFIIEQRQVKTDSAKVKAVVEWPTPSSWFRFILDCRVAAPITQHTSWAIPFVWTNEVHLSFTKLVITILGIWFISTPDSNQLIYFLLKYSFYLGGTDSRRTSVFFVVFSSCLFAYIYFPVLQDSSASGFCSSLTTGCLC